MVASLNNKHICGTLDCHFEPKYSFYVTVILAAEG